MPEMGNPKILSIAELIRGGSPLTASSSSSSSTKSTGPNPSPKVLTPLNHPAILIGILTLPSLTLTCPNSNCLQFNDESSSHICCCDVLHLHPRAIGTKIRVLAWNFLPLTSHGSSGCFLEIIKFEFLDTSDADSFPLVSGFHSANANQGESDSKSRYCIQGVVESVSPLSTVPSSDGRGSNSMCVRGFLVRIMACECILRCSKGSESVLRNVNCVLCGYSFAKPLFVYFCGATSSWHPVMTKLVGGVIRLLGMRKKLVFMSREKSQLMFVTTENSVLHLPRLLSEKRFGFRTVVVEGRGECGTYMGIVKDVYMKGMLLELDEEVWVLLTDQILNRPHSLRVGAIICVRNVHFVNPNFSWAKMLILGACFKTSITVVSFSPLETRCLTVSYSQSSLVKFIASLSFPARLWTLLVTSCFQDTFAGKTLEKEAMGSNHKEELAKLYVESHVPAAMFQARHGLFMEFCMHESCGCNNGPYDCNLKLRVPILSFIKHGKFIMKKLLLEFEKDCGVFSGTNCFGHTSSLWKPYGESNRKTFLSEDIGVVLLGCLQISPSSGRLQLLDWTGSIDVIVPDLPSNWSTRSIYEVTDYSLTIEGTPQSMDHFQFPKKSFSCRSVLHCAPLAIEQTVRMFISFHLGLQSCRNVCLYPSLDCKDDIRELEGGMFHLFRVTHKFPVLQNFKGDPEMPNNRNMFIEAIILPWNLVCAVREENTNPASSSRNRHKVFKEFDRSRISEDPALKKRRRTFDTSSRELISGFVRDSEDSCHAPSISCSPLELIEENKSQNLSNFHEIPCLVTFRSVDDRCLSTSGILHYAKSTGTNNKQSAEGLLLEVSSEMLGMFHWLQIGGCYMIKHNIEDSFCNSKQSGDLNDDKIILSQGTRFWSLGFCFDEGLRKSKVTEDHHSVLLSSSSWNKGLPGQQVEQQGLFTSSRVFSEVSLHLPSDAARHFTLCLKPVVKVEEKSSVSWCTSPATMHDLGSGTSGSKCLFPEGNLLSLCGNVVAIESSSCIHVMVNNQTVKIFGSLRRHAYLTGFARGVNATFYRILELRVENEFLLLPVSFITINSLTVGDPCMTSHLPASSGYEKPFQDDVSVGFVSDLVSRCKDNNPMSFLCRVVSLRFLILQKSPDHLPERQPGPHIDIPLAGFVLDDGSSTCCCWANGERASRILRVKNFEHLERIVQHYGRIVVRNYGSVVDSKRQHLTISGDYGITSLGEEFLHFLMLNACVGPLWRVTASTMHLDTIRQLVKEHLLVEMPMHSMQNVWANEVSPADPLDEARKVVQDLLNW